MADRDVSLGYGRETGDEFLNAMARQISGALRGEDILVRLGGDEFVLICPGPAVGDSTAETAHAFAQRAGNSTIAKIPTRKKTIDDAGASVGVVAIDPRATTTEETLKLAGQTMYEVKRARRAAVQR